MMLLAVGRAQPAPLHRATSLVSPTLLASIALLTPPSTPRAALLLRSDAQRHPPVLATEDVISPFEEGSEKTMGIQSLELTLENVETVLDEMRPYLKADGGDVAVRGIEDGIVQLELQGACGSCPSSTVTMQMGLERGLREKIPTIKQVVQVAPEGPTLTAESVDQVLEEIRPFLKMAGGTVDLVSLDSDSVQPTAHLEITGSGSTINSVRVEIAQRLKRNFPTLANVTWK